MAARGTAVGSEAIAAQREHARSGALVERRSEENRGQEVARGQETGKPKEVPVTLIDTDVHPDFSYEGELADYMDAPFRDRTVQKRLGRAVLLPPNGGRRTDSYPKDGKRPGSDPELFDKQVLEEAGVDFAIHTELLAGPAPDPDHNAAIRRGLNRWMADTWLGKYNKHGRYKGSISIPVNNVEAAVREIEEWAGHPHFVQIQVPAIPGGGHPPYGHPYYHPIWEAAARHNLPVAMHVNAGGATVTGLTPVGFVRRFVEYHALTYPVAYATHFVSLICEGVFDRFENFRFVFIEGGFSWLGPMLWRLERNWDRFKVELEPEVKRRPRDYVRDHIRFASQPVEEPENPKDLVKMYELIDAKNILMFATDYPHWDYDDPVRAFPRMPKDWLSRIYCENAREFYNLPKTRPA